MNKALLPATLSWLFFGLREIAGWALVVLGLGAFLLVWALAVERQIIQLGFVAFFGIIIFRGGIHLIKVNVAARIALQAQDKVYLKK